MADHEGTSVLIPDLNEPDNAPDPTDPGGWGAQFAAKLQLQLGKLDTLGDAMNSTTDELRKLRREARQQPALVKLSSAFSWNSQAGAPMCQQNGSGAGVLICGPNVGESWNVLQIVVGGPTLSSVWTGAVYFLVAAAPPNEQSITSAIDRALPPAAGPAIAFYSPQQFYVAPNENLYMVVVGGTNGAQYVGSVMYQSTPFVPRGTETTV